MNYDFMLDIETLGTKTGSIVLQIGLAVFEKAPSYKIVAEFDLRPNRLEQERAGLREDPETVAWWKDTDPELFEELYNTKTFMTQAHILNTIQDTWRRFGSKSSRILCQGASFDFAMVKAMFDATGIHEDPWPFWAERDTRTIYEEHGFNPKAVTFSGGGRKHDAVADCRHQIRLVQLARQDVAEKQVG